MNARAAAHAFWPRAGPAHATHRNARPYCAAFKPVVMWRALLESEPGAYVMWADASKYRSNVTLLPGLRAAVALLQGERGRPAPPPALSGRWARAAWWRRHQRREAWAPLAIGSAYGQVTCSAFDCASDLYTWAGQTHAVNEQALAGFAEMVPDGRALLQRPLLLNSNLLLENTRPNRELARRAGRAVGPPPPRHSRRRPHP